MKKLIEGLQQFMTTVHQPETEFFQGLASGQQPEVLFVTCSDSRLSPNLLTQTRPGDLFVVRNAGNIVPKWREGESGGEAASIEFAVGGLGVTDVVICGHSDCGAMKALLDLEQAKALPTVVAWLDNAERTAQIVHDTKSTLPKDARLNAAIEVNVLVQLAQLTTHPFVARSLEEGKLRLHGWVHDIGTGGTRGFDAGQGRFVRLDRAVPPISDVATLEKAVA